MTDNFVETTRDYYDSGDANAFYLQIWGGEDIHIGIYENASQPISDASRTTIETMLRYLPPLSKSSRILDIGAGFGGAARHLSKKLPCHITCLNLSGKQNEFNRKMNEEAGLSKRIEVDDGNFEKLPYRDAEFDVVWAQDAILHSTQKETVMKEAFRVLKNGGTFVFTDPMQDASCSTESLRPILDRIHLDSLETPETYETLGKKAGFLDVHFHDFTPHLKTHYSRVRQELMDSFESKSLSCSKEYVDKMQQGLQHWIDAGKKQWLRWGVFTMKKP